MVLPVKQKPLTIRDTGDSKNNMNNVNFAVEQLWNLIKKQQEDLARVKDVSLKDYVKNSDLGNHTTNIIENNITTILDNAGGFTGTITFVE
jgi:hypothetical protein